MMPQDDAAAAESEPPRCRRSLRRADDCRHEMMPAMPRYARHAMLLSLPAAAATPQATAACR